jgi:hypothetical protein
MERRTARICPVGALRARDPGGSNRHQQSDEILRTEAGYQGGAILIDLEIVREHVCAKISEASRCAAVAFR